MGGASGGVLEAARSRIREGLAEVTVELEAAGMPSPAWEGKLIRPVMGLAGAPGEVEPKLWRGLAAVQLAHEASLVHDDVIDGADRRRGRPTVAGSRGVAAALVEGDHLLTAAYRLAAGTGSLEWMELFAQAVERTVAGEKAQARATGRVLDWEEYEAIVLGKSGELMGVAFALGPSVRGEWNAHRYYEVGRRVGLVYQMLDDLLDYCVHEETGKPSLVDYRRGLWTWPRLGAELEDGLDDDQVDALLRQPDDTGVSPLERSLARFRSETQAVRSELAALGPASGYVEALLDRWLERAESAVRPRPEAVLPAVEGWEELMAEHAKSFRFASRLFPADRREQVVSVYAWCRYTDDLVDGVDLPPRQLEARLDAWLNLSRRAYEGGATGNPLADRVMTEMREAGVPFGYATELIEGMRMDVRGVEYGTLAELWTYTFRVASVVGLWMTELFGIRDPWMLDRAASLGHAMQLTNILRDVGEDLEAGRLYLPHTWLRAYDLDRADLDRMARTGEIDDRYRALVERLLRVAEAEYDHASPAIARLPGFYRRPVAVAADVYRGIHEAIRENGYDNLTARAYTGLTTKLRLGAGALLRTRSTAASGIARSAAAFGLAAGLLLPATAVSGQQHGAAGLITRPAEVPLQRIDAPPPAARAFEALGDLWVAGVEDEAAVEAGLRTVEEVRRRLQLSAPRDRLLRAYEGAFTALLAKHGGWPGERMRNLREGFSLMDTAVSEAPESAKLRYIRLMSGFYLPGIFGRAGEVDEDLAALTRLLPGARGDFPAALYPEVVLFVLDHASPSAAERRELEGLLR